jgi:hypothetical protein
MSPLEACEFLPQSNVTAGTRFQFFSMHAKRCDAVCRAVGTASDIRSEPRERRRVVLAPAGKLVAAE